MSLHILSLLALFTASTLPAQVTLDVHAATNFIVTSERAGQTPVTKVLPFRSPVPSKFSLVAGLQSAVFNHSVSGDRVSYACDLATNSTGGTTNESGSIKGTILLWLKSRVTLQGSLTIRFESSGPQVGTAWTSTHVVQSSLFAPQWNLSTFTVMKSYKVTLDTKGIWIGHADHLKLWPLTVGWQRATLGVEFQPDVSIDNYGSICTIGLDAGLDSGNRIVLRGQDLTGYTSLVVGIRAADIPIPGSSCRLYTDPVIIAPWTGAGVLRLPRPPGKYTVFAQTVALIPIPSYVATSNGVRIQQR